MCNALPFKCTGMKGDVARRFRLGKSLDSGHNRCISMTCDQVLTIRLPPYAKGHPECSWLAMLCLVNASTTWPGVT